MSTQFGGVSPEGKTIVVRLLENEGVPQVSVHDGITRSMYSAAPTVVYSGADALLAWDALKKSTKYKKW